jgi:hypothetical protein
MLSPKVALQAGMIDKVVSFEELVNSLSAPTTSRNQKGGEKRE